ncbi:PucR family transcriptional regulator [Yinghuangia sp. YIM S09857]|uniref:PucR family transcriptional regulator n=1 Tax=Yinghuangia sp. YIM S09857 TaxID=3436929 RepID=UPI003F538A84
MRDSQDGDDYLAGYEVLLDEVSRTGRRLTREEIDVRRLEGERAAVAGRRLRDMVVGHLAATRAAWPGLSGIKGAVGQRDLSAAALAVLGATEQAVDAFSQGYDHAQRLAVRREEAARREFVDDLLYGRSDLGSLSERAQRFGLRLARSHTVAVAVGDEPYDETHPVTRRVESALTGRFGNRRILLTTKDGRLVCVAPSDGEDGGGAGPARYFAKQAHAATGGGRVVLGRSHPGPGGVVLSYEEALSGHHLATRMGFDAPVIEAADLLVYPVLARDREALADLVRTVLGPLTSARGGAEPLLRTLEVYFDAGCVSAEAARRLELSVRALTYRLERIARFTGADPGEPLERYTLQTAVIGARLLDWPAQEL